MVYQYLSYHINFLHGTMEVFQYPVVLTFIIVIQLQYQYLFQIELTRKEKAFNLFGEVTHKVCAIKRIHVPCIYHVYVLDCDFEFLSFVDYQQLR